ncbi:hypothetical protein [Brevibacillus sp. SYSU BS000544]|uniref:hypothetical protein n=1 Tax=Brevibacillus sp. SYSU BS000544 TaxID=3416443 RepID=UPI003CE4546D
MKKSCLALIIAATLLTACSAGQGSNLSFKEMIDQAEHIHTIYPQPKGEQLLIGSHGGMFASAEKSWKSVESLKGQDVMGIFVDPENPEMMYITGHGFSKRSEDGGKMWKDNQEGLPANPDIHSLTGAKVNGEVKLFAYVVNTGIFANRSGKWELVNTPKASIHALAYDEKNDRIFALTDDGVLIGRDGLWAKDQSLTSKEVLTFAVNNQKGITYSSTAQGIFTQQEDGSWQKAFDNPSGEQVYYLSVREQTDELIGLTEKGNIYALTNGKWSLK